MNNNTNTKYRFDEADTIMVGNRKLYRIIALRDIGDRVKAGDKGGYIESQKNLLQYGRAWVFENAKVFDNAKICGNAQVCGNAKVSGFAEVSGNARVSYNAWVSGSAQVFGCATISDNTHVADNARVYDNANVYGNAWVYGNAKISGCAKVYGDTCVYGFAWVYGDAQVYDNAWVGGTAQVYGSARISGNACVSDKEMICWFSSFGSVGRTTTAFIEKSGEWCVNCGCFSGTIAKFRKQVEDTHGDSPIAQEYFIIADLIEFRAKRIKEKTEDNNE